MARTRPASWWPLLIILREIPVYHSFSNFGWRSSEALVTLSPPDSRRCQPRQRSPNPPPQRFLPQRFLHPTRTSFASPCIWFSINNVHALRRGAPRPHINWENISYWIRKKITYTWQAALLLVVWGGRFAPRGRRRKSCWQVVLLTGAPSWRTWTWFRQDFVRLFINWKNLKLINNVVELDRHARRSRRMRHGHREHCKLLPEWRIKKC